jgi:carboxylesterase type B
MVRMLDSAMSRRVLMQGAVGIAAGAAVGGAALADGSEPVVRTAQGALRGRVENGVAIFRGVPYARPPVGRLRLRPPERAPRWDGVRDAGQWGAICPQSDGSPLDTMSLRPGVPHSDDCLNLNVWTPSPGAAGLPVFVWIHGGSFKWGSGSVPGYDGATFARDGLVAVTFNYRLGALGFLNTGDHPGTGNFGLLDQIAALEWVAENIAAFGGDPAKVTVAGESAGGFSIGQLLGIPRATRLFRRAIMQSGGSQMHIAAPASRLIGERLLQRAGVDPRDRSALDAVSSADLIRAQVALEPEAPRLLRDAGLAQDAHPQSFVHLAPTYGADLLPQPALEAIAGGSARGVGLIAGWNTDETRMFWPTRDLAPLGLAPVEAGLDAAFRAAGQTGRQVLDGYRSRRPGASELDALYPAATDLVFRIPTLNTAAAALPHSADTYVYRFDWKGAFGACHGLDVAFAWDTLAANPGLSAALGGADAPQSLASRMHAAWGAFAKTGAPAAAGLPAWPRYRLDDRLVMNLDTVSSIIGDPDAEERRLWEVSRF